MMKEVNIVLKQTLAPAGRWWWYIQQEPSKHFFYVSKTFETIDECTHDVAYRTPVLLELLGKSNEPV